MVLEHGVAVLGARVPPAHDRPLAGHVRRDLVELLLRPQLQHDAKRLRPEQPPHALKEQPAQRVVALGVLEQVRGQPERRELRRVPRAAARSMLRFSRPSAATMAASEESAGGMGCCMARQRLTASPRQPWGP